MRGVVAALLDRVPDRVPRTYARFFDVANACACAAWIVLARDALREKRSARARRFVVDGAVATLCAAYAWLLVACVAKGVDARASFGSLAGVRALFERDDALLAGWLHFLAFDARVADWLIDEERARGVPRMCTACVTLPLTFACGPVGYAWSACARKVLARETRRR